MALTEAGGGTNGFAVSTLGATQDIKSIVKTPKGEKVNEWLAVNTVDFFNEISLLYGIITDFCTKETCPCMSAGPKYEYLWADGIKYKKPIKVSATEYVDLLMTWVEDMINNEQIFPMEEGNRFPKNFKTIVKTIFKRLFRVYGHIYHSHIQKYVQLDAEAHLNSCFKVCTHTLSLSLYYLQFCIDSRSDITVYFLSISAIYKTAFLLFHR